MPRFNPDKDKYADAKAQKKVDTRGSGNQASSPYAGYAAGNAQLGNIQNALLGSDKFVNDPLARAIKLGIAGNQVQDKFNTFNSENIANFQAGLSGQMMNLAADIGSTQRAEDYRQQFMYGMMANENNLGFKQAYDLSTHQLGLSEMAAQGEILRANNAAASTELQNQEITRQEQDRLTNAASNYQLRENMTLQDNLRSKREAVQADRANRGGRNF